MDKERAEKRASALSEQAKKAAQKEADITAAKKAFEEMSSEWCRGV